MGFAIAKPEGIVNNPHVYGDSEWKDLLTTYNGQTITYDAIGNPLTYRDGITMTWQNGRELATFSNDEHTMQAVCVLQRISQV